MAQKGRYVILDALRGIAGLCVPILHYSETFTAPHDGAPGVMQVCGHGYLAVEFFLLLMGYMLGFAYDRRWNEGMDTLDFARRRLRRLHPFVLSGLALGLVLYGAQLLGSPTWFPWLKDASAGAVAWYVVAGALVIPAFGSSLMAPFNACTWTLYYEYWGNILYGVVLRRASRWILGVLSVVLGLLSIAYVFHFDPGSLVGLKMMKFAFGESACTLAGGWGTRAAHWWCGFIRLLFPLVFGLFLFRTGWKIRLPSRLASPLAVFTFLVVLFMPYSYGLDAPFPLPLWINGAFEILVLMLILPLLILIGVGAGTSPAEGGFARTAAFFAELSYPLYMTHYPIYEIHNWWVRSHSAALSPTTCCLISAAEYAFCLVAAYGVMRLWDRILLKRK